jgi:hypothetical protein
MRPRSLTLMPWVLARSRAVALSGAPGLAVVRRRAGSRAEGMRRVSCRSPAGCCANASASGAGRGVAIGRPQLQWPAGIRGCGCRIWDQDGRDVACAECQLGGMACRLRRLPVLGAALQDLFRAGRAGVEGDLDQLPPGASSQSPRVVMTAGLSSGAVPELTRLHERNLRSCSWPAGSGIPVRRGEEDVRTDAYHGGTGGSGPAGVAFRLLPSLRPSSQASSA